MIPAGFSGQVHTCCRAAAGAGALPEDRVAHRDIDQRRETEEAGITVPEGFRRMAGIVEKHEAEAVGAQGGAPCAYGTFSSGTVSLAADFMMRMHQSTSAE